MRYKKVLLIVPRYKHSHYRPVLSTGVGFLAQSLKEKDINYEYCDLGFFKGYRELRKKIKEFKPALFAISLLSYRYKDHYNLISSLKRDYPKVDIVVGGPHVTMLKEKILSDCPVVNFAVVLEGERALIELCQGNSPEKIPGLIWRNNREIIYNSYKSYVQNLDDIAYPRYEKFNLDRYLNKEFNIIPIVTSRGCSFRCSYCPVPNSMGQIFRTRTAKDVVDEIEYWYRLGYRRFGISDDNFTFVRRRVFEICDEIDKRNLKDLRISCDNGIRADCTDYEMLERMRKAGFWRIAFGVESGSPKVLKSINKDLSLETIEGAINDACSLGYVVRLFFLIGSPNESIEDFRESIKLAQKFPIGEASFYTLIPFPETSLYNWIKKNGYFVFKNEKEYLNYASGWINKPIFETPYFTKKERKWAFKYGQKINRKIVHNFLRKRLKKFGLIGDFTSLVYSFYTIRKVLNWPVVRKLVILLTNKMIKEVLNQPVFETVKEHLSLSVKPKVSVIIPSLDGYRGGNLAKLVDDLKKQTFCDFEVHIIKGVSPQGKAINMGASKAKGEILLIMDDDSRLGNPDVIKNLVKTIKNKSIGMVGASILPPPDANWLQKRAAREFPRFGMRVVNKITETDMACHGCCAFRKEVFEEVGRERENILRGLDPDLRVRLRNAGYKVVLAPDSWVYHPLPETFSKLIRTFFRNGIGSAYAQRYQPELIYDTDETLEMKDFKPKKTFAFRIVRFPVRLLKALFTFKFLRFIAYIVYAIGYWYGYVKYSITNNH